MGQLPYAAAGEQTRTGRDRHYPTLTLFSWDTEPKGHRAEGPTVMTGVWNRRERERAEDPQLRGKQTLPEVLEHIDIHALSPYPTLRKYLKGVEDQVPHADQHVLWRELSARSSRAMREGPCRSRPHLA
jgi:hypothetical protein